MQWRRVRTWNACQRPLVEGSNVGRVSETGEELKVGLGITRLAGVVAQSQLKDLLAHGGALVRARGKAHG